MYYRGNYSDSGDAREMGFKRQRIMDQGSSYYATPPGSSYLYNPPPPPPPPAYSYHGQPPPFPVVRLRGLPFDCSETEIADFLHGLDVVDVLLVHKGGRFTGEAYCVLGYPLQVDFALQRNRQNIGRRYVEVFRSKKEEYYKAIANEVFDSRGGSVPRARSLDDSKDSAEHTGVLWLRGLPFSASKEDIIDFFKDFELEEKSIHITATFEGRPTGEAFVEFASADDSRAAMAKDRMTIGNRYIELFPSSPEELEEAVSRGRVLDKPVDGRDPNEVTSVLRMRGLPFSAGKDDIMDFFKDFVLSEDAIHVTFLSDGRPTGEAFVEFASTDDAKAALAKDRMTLGSRYVELFPSSLQDMNYTTSRGRYSCFYNHVCSLWISFGVYVTGILFQTVTFVSFLLISNGYCITCERLSIQERRITAAFGCIFYLTHVGYRASVPYFSVLLTLSYFISFYVIFKHISQNLIVLQEQLTFIADEEIPAVHEAIYTKYTMLKKFQNAMLMMAVAELAILINVDNSIDNYWLRLLVREWAQFCILSYIGWIFRSKDLAPRFSVMPVIKSIGERMIPPIYSIEMDAATFKDFSSHGWHIGVPTSPKKGSLKNSVLVVVQHPHVCRLTTPPDTHSLSVA